MLPVCRQRGEDRESRTQVRLSSSEGGIRACGTYFDWDVHSIRDLKPLGEAGFANVVGLEKYGNVGTECYMSVKGSELMRLWLKNERIVFDGGWTHVRLVLSTKCLGGYLRYRERS